jgi:D-alanyl-D-alanine carboxypeptidase
MRYSEKGLLSLGDPLGKYLKDSELDGLLIRNGKNEAAEISLKQLVSNRSGIADYYQLKHLDPLSDVAKLTQADPGWDFQDALNMAKSLPNESEKVRKRASYSFTNFQILSEVLERVSGQSLAEVFESEVIDPMALKGTKLLTKGNLALFEQAAPVLYGEQQYLGAARMASLRGEGALISTTDDLIKFLRGVNSGHLISEESLSSMREPNFALFPLIRYGMGLMKIRIPGPLIGSLKSATLYGHLGATGSFAFWEQKTDTYIAGTVNQMGNRTLGTKLLFALTSKVVKHL